MCGNHHGNHCRGVYGGDRALSPQIILPAPGLIIDDISTQVVSNGSELHKALS